MRLHEEVHRNSTLYRVEDDSSRDLVANEDLYRRLHEGDVVECRIARPPLLPRQLMSCSAARALSAPIQRLRASLASGPRPPA